VAPRSASLYAYAETNPKSKAITVFEGDKINILRMPEAPGQQWVPVQLIRDNKAKPPGYMRIVDLEKWGPNFKLALINLFQPGEAGNDDQIRAKLDELEQLISRFPDAQASRRAQIEMAGLELKLVQRMKENAKTYRDWQPHVASADQHLAHSGGAEPSIMEQYQRQVAALNEEATAAAAAETPQPPPPATVTGSGSRRRNVDKLNDAQVLFDRTYDLTRPRQDIMSDLTKAEQLVEQVLKADTNNAEAKTLQGHIADRKDYFENYRK
jgi:hypothetical protein